MMSPVSANVQPGLTISGPTPDQFGMRGNITPIMSTPQSQHPQHAISSNVRIDGIPPPHQQAQNSVNSTDPSRTQNHIYAPPTVPSNGFAPQSITGPSQSPTSVPPAVSPVPSSAVSAATGLPVSSVTSSSGAPAIPSLPSTSTPSLPHQNSSIPASPAQNTRSVPKSNSRRSRVAGRKPARGARSRNTIIQAENLATNGTDRPVTHSPQQDPSNATLASFASPPDGLSSSALIPASIQTVNSSLMAPSPVTPHANNNGSTISTGHQLMAPPSEGIYRTFEELLTQIQATAKEQGYGIVKLRASNYREGKATRYDLVCDRGGVKYNSTAKKRNPSTRKVDCPWRAKAVCEVQLGNHWRFQVQDSRHNHEPRIQTSAPGVEQTPANQVLRSITNKLDRVSHELTNTLNRMESKLDGFGKRLDDIETRIANIESQNRMDIPMDDVERGLLGPSAMLPGSQPTDPNQPNQGQMAQFSYTTA